MRFAPAAAAATVLLTLAACGSAASTSSSSSGGGAVSSSSGSGGSAAAYTLSTASVAGLGTVLVNGNGQTMYVLSSEKGGKVTCTDSSGCTAVWPDTQLPSGVSAGIAGSGVQASLLGTAMGADGNTYLTYGTYPVYTYKGDSGPGSAGGQGIQSFGGTWTVIGADGNPVTSGSSSGGSSNGGSGY